MVEWKQFAPNAVAVLFEGSFEKEKNHEKGLVLCDADYGFVDLGMVLCRLVWGV